MSRRNCHSKKRFMLSLYFRMSQTLNIIPVITVTTLRCVVFFPVVSFYLSSFFLRLISAVGDWMSIPYFDTWCGLSAKVTGQLADTPTRGKYLCARWRRYVWVFTFFTVLLFPLFKIFADCRRCELGMTCVSRAPMGELHSNFTKACH